MSGSILLDINFRACLCLVLCEKILVLASRWLDKVGGVCLDLADLYAQAAACLEVRSHCNVMCVSVGWGHCVLECVALGLDAGVIVSLFVSVCSDCRGWFMPLSYYWCLAAAYICV